MKKSKIVRTIALLMSIMLVFSGCGKKNNTTDSGKQDTGKVDIKDDGDTKDDGEPKEIVDIEVMVYERGKEFSKGNSTVDNEMTRWINSQLEPLGVHATYVPIPRSGADDKINLMLAGGEAPDIVMTYDLQRVSTYGKQEGIVDLAPYVDRLDPGFLERFGSALEYTQFDGKQFAIPRVFEKYGRSHMAYLRKDLVEGMNKEMPTNRDELIDVLYAMKEAYPDITPYAFSGKVTDAKYTNFLLTYTSRANERDNYIYEPSFTNILKPGHKEGLKQLNRFVLDGIIDPNFAVDVDETKYLQDIANGKVGFVSDNATDALKAYGVVDNENYEMVAVDLWKNVDGSYEVPSASPVSNYVYVPKASEDKIDAIMTYLGWISNYENALNVEMGIIGVGSEKNSSGVPVLKSEAELLELGLNPVCGDMNMLMRGFDFGEEASLAANKVAYPDAPEEVLSDYLKVHSTNYYDPVVITSSLETDQYVPLLQSLICEFVFKVMSAPEGQFDAVYEKEYQKLLDNHLQEVLDERAAWYDANK
jgi:putative aldouronate transport system substrate-binding protein|nr:extracellular solute-binding protein [uncultured Lachnoclostridium sp.]